MYATVEGGPGKANLRVYRLSSYNVITVIIKIEAIPKVRKVFTKPAAIRYAGTCH